MGQIGIATYDAVSATADTLLASGQNPTVQAVRAALDGGSPNTVLKHLNTWREKLGERLLALQRQRNVPAALTDGMQQLWDGALKVARQESDAALAAERAALAEERAQLDRDHETRKQRELALQQEADRLRQAWEATQAQTAELQQRVDQSRRDLQAEQERARTALADLGRVSADAAGLRAQLEQLQVRLAERQQAEDQQRGHDLSRIDALSQQLQASRQSQRQAERKREAADQAAAAALARVAELTGRIQGLEASNALLGAQLDSSRADLSRLAESRPAKPVAKKRKPTHGRTPKT